MVDKWWGAAGGNNAVGAVAQEQQNLLTVSE
jgi:hypothetical protein